VFLGVEIDPARAQRRLETRYLDEIAPDLDTALRRAQQCKQDRVARSIAVIGNAADVYAELVRRGAPLDLVTDQTSAHDPLVGYIPQGLSLAEAAELRRRDPDEYVRRARESMAVQVEAMVAMKQAGAGELGAMLDSPVVSGAGALAAVASAAGASAAVLARAGASPMAIGGGRLDTEGSALGGTSEDEAVARTKSAGSAGGGGTDGSRRGASALGVEEAFTFEPPSETIACGWIEPGPGL
jgi:hypothetical protein